MRNNPTGADFRDDLIRARFGNDTDINVFNQLFIADQANTGCANVFHVGANPTLGCSNRVQNLAGGFRARKCAFFFSGDGFLVHTSVDLVVEGCPRSNPIIGNHERKRVILVAIS